MYRLVPITLEEYRILFDAGVWVYGSDYAGSSNYIHPLEEVSDALFPDWRKREWRYCYTRVEQEQP